MCYFQGTETGTSNLSQTVRVQSYCRLKSHRCQRASPLSMLFLCGPVNKYREAWLLCQLTLYNNFYSLRNLSILCLNLHFLFIKRLAEGNCMKITVCLLLTIKEMQKLCCFVPFSRSLSQVENNQIHLRLSSILLYCCICERRKNVNTPFMLLV